MRTIKPQYFLANTIMVDNETNGDIYGLWVAAIGALTTSIGILASIVIKKNETKKTVELEQIKVDKANIEKDLKEALVKVTELTRQMESQRSAIAEKDTEIIGHMRKIYAAKVSFGLLLLQYEKVFENDKTSLALMKQFYEKIIIDQ